MDVGTTPLEELLAVGDTVVLRPGVKRMIGLRPGELGRITQIWHSNDTYSITNLATGDACYPAKGKRGHFSQKVSRFEVMKAPATAKPVATAQPVNQEQAQAGYAPASAAFAVGDRVEVHWQDEGAWYAGTVTAADAGAGTVDVVYDDGDDEGGVALAHVRRIEMDAVAAPPAPWRAVKMADGRGYYHNTATGQTSWTLPDAAAAPPPPPPPPPLAVGDRVKVYRRGYGEWVAGRVTAIGGGTVDVAPVPTDKQFAPCSVEEWAVRRDDDGLAQM